MDWVWKALLTAGSVLLVMLLARHGGRRAAGTVAALPTVTAPALAWLAHDRGDAFAADAALASLAACAMLAGFAVAHAHVARHRGVVTTLACGTVGAALFAAPAAVASTTLAGALALALFSCVLALLCLPAPPRHALLPARTPVAATALAASGLGVVTVALAPLLGSFASGLVASLPLVSGAVAASEHASTGHHGVAQFLRGYVQGLLARAAFCAAFALLAVPLGWIAAVAVSAALAGAVGFLVHRMRLPSVRRPSYDISLRARHATE
jgi:uncharacterized membrane protein (GlpM family)